MLLSITEQNIIWAVEQDSPESTRSQYMFDFDTMDPSYAYAIDPIEHPDMESDTIEHTDEYVDVPDIGKNIYFFFAKKKDSFGECIRMEDTQLIDFHFHLKQFSKLPFTTLITIFTLTAERQLNIHINVTVTVRRQNARLT